ncbi:MAG: hypothetical protein BHV69_10080 [Bacteroidales bacterium 52_46]|nr:MAG: hypothetical protein BHV69_10080 [Bacteroidales bacterium 52_46]
MIKDIIELNFPKKDGKQYVTLSQATVTLQDMAEKTITTQVRIDGQITPDFSYDWAVSFKGNKYIFPFRIPPGSIDDTSLLSTVDLTFQHWAVYELKRQYFFSVPNLEAGTTVPDKYVTPVSLNLRDFCKLFAMVLAYYYDNKIAVDLYEGWEADPAPVTVEISYTKIWDVLIKLYELYGVRWQIEPNGDIDHYVIKVGYPTTEVSHVFEHGFKGGLLKFEQQVQDDIVRNMIYGRGGNKNLPYRYFKKHDEDNKTFSPDPDWIPELKDIPFTELRGATFRSYIQGWKAKHIAEYRSEYPEEEWVVTTPAAEQAYAPWAWRKGYTDGKFDPVEYVKDNESIKRYGELPDALDNNEEIFPTIQGIEFEGLGRIDETVKIEEIKSNEVEPDKDNDAVVITPAVCKDTVYNVPPSSYQEFTIQSVGNFFVSDGKHGDLEVSVKALSATRTDDKYIDVSTSAEVVAGSQTVTVVNADTGEEHSATGIPPGKWYYRVKARVRNLTASYNLNIEVGDLSPKLTESTINATVKNAWHIWVKNIWQSSKLPTETAAQYAKRIWSPILGDRESNEAKVIFTDGMLAMSQDYEFSIVGIPTYDPNEKLPVKDNDGNVIGYYPSHWCIPLGKSDADLEATGTYVPSTMRFAEAGNHIAFIGIDMPHLYVVEAEKRLDNWKKDNLDKVKDIAPSAVIKLDPVRIHNYGKADALVDSLVPGNSIRVADKRFILNQDGTPASFETLYLQSVTYTYNEPTETEANLLPDVEVVLSDKYEVVANPVERLTGEVTELHKQIGSISNVSQIVRAVGDKRYLRKDMYDRASAPIDFMQGFDSYKHSILRDGVQFGTSFAEGVTGFGGKIDRYGEAWLGGLHLRSFLEVPEFRYNRTEISIGNAWNAPGGGIIERVSPDYNADGSLANTGTITLHLEDGEIGAVAIGDLCSGIFHDEQNLSNNSSVDSDDGQGNFHFAGFCTVYFTPTEILEKNRNSAFRYELRPVSAQWTQRFHPSAQMHFVGYGNNAKNTDGSWKYPERQKSRYSTRTYERYLVNVNNWEFGAHNIAAQFGNLSNLSIQGINMSGYSAYLNNIYMTGHIEQLDLSLRMEVDYGNDNFMAYGETRMVKCRVFRGWQEVTDSDNIEWSVTRDTGNAEEDAAWNSKLKVAAFKGEIAIRYNDAENDLGSTPETGAIFTFTAKVDGETVWTKLTLRRNPQDGTDGTAGRNYTHNLLLGSEFPATRRWRPAQNVDIDNTHTLEGRNSIRSSQSDLSASAWRGITQDYAGTIQAGDVFTASAWCYCENLGGIDAGVRLEIQVFAGNERVATGATSLEPSKAGEWQQAKTTVTIPEGATRMAVTLYVNRNGTVWFSSPKLERGENAAPEWTPNPADRIGTPTEMFYLSTSNTELAGGNWSFNKPAATAGRYLWTRTELLYGDGTVELTEPICVTGEDAYSVTLTNESHVFEEGVAAMVDCGISALKGNVRVPVTIGTISGMPPSAGMQVSVIGNGSTSATVRVRVAASLAVGGVLTIPVTVDGLVFQKTFSWSIARQGQTGPQGIQGCIYRVTQWAAGFDYHNDSAQTGNGIRYIDVVLIPNPALATKAYAYICKEGHTSTAENAPGVNADTSGNNTWWEMLNSMAPIYTPFLLADGARISLLQSNQILVMKEEDASIVNVGFGGGKIPLWIGATNPAEANFRVDDTGKAYMTGAEISGQVTAGDPNGQRVALLPDDKTMKIYDENGHEASSFEGNTYADPLNLFGLTFGNIAMKQRTGTDYGYGLGITYGRGSHTLIGDGLGTNTYYENLNISVDSGSTMLHSDAPVEVKVSGYLYTEYKEQATLPSYPNGTVTSVASGDTPVTDLTPIDPGGTVPLYNSTARLTLYIDTYSDQLLTTRVGSQEIARCSKKNDGVLIVGKRVKTTMGGYHVLRLAISMTTTGNGVRATVKWGGEVSGQLYDISGTYTSDFYMSRYFANGFCLGISMNNYISAYDQGDKKGMRFVMENNGYGIDVSDAGIRHKHHGGNWVSMPLFVMKARYGYTNGSYIRYDSKSFNGSYPSLSHKGQGWVRLTYPPEWSTLGTLSAANLIVHVTGYGASAEDGKSPLKATVTVITSEYIDITLSDDESPNDGGFLIDISLLE